MERVEQHDIDGCGVACFAMLTGQTYPEVLATLNPGQASWTDQSRLIEALQEAGYHLNVRFNTPIRDLETSLLVVRYRIAGEIYMHCVVWDAERQAILDPYDTRSFEEYENGLMIAYEVRQVNRLS
jgi:hypothetical protein